MKLGTPIFSKLKNLVIVLLAVMTFGSASFAAPETAPETTLKSFLRAMYARDVATAYPLLASIDRNEKSFEDYRSENGSFDGNTLTLSRSLANEIRFDRFETEIEGDRATITLSANLPDANADELEAVVDGFNRRALSDLQPEEISARLAQIQALAASDALSIIKTEGEEWQLIREDGNWRVLLNWAEAVEVSFDAFVIGDLDWQFEPLRKRVIARHGETIEMAYRAKNIGDHVTTGKARHIIGPTTDADFMEIVACFCFLEQTLEPGEETTLPLVFRIDFEAPETVTAFNVRYEFFPLGTFPKGLGG